MVIPIELHNDMVEKAIKEARFNTAIACLLGFAIGASCGIYWSTVKIEHRAEELASLEKKIGLKRIELFNLRSR